MDFQSIHITYNFQHFEPIQYGNGLSRCLLTFQVNDPKVTINLNDFPSFFKISGATTFYSIITINNAFLLE